MIREAISNDLESIYNLGSLLHPNYRIINNLKDFLNNNIHHLYVFELDNKIVGFIHYTKLYNSVDLVDIVVEEKYQNQKIGTNLIDYIITNLEINDRIYLEVNTNNQKAINLYQKFGFKIINIRKNYYGIDDAYVMERVI